MEAGRLQHRITIQRQIKNRSASGQRKGEWEDFATVWAEVQCTDSKAVDESGAIQHEGLYRFYIRYMRGITAEMRVAWNDGSGDKPRIFQMVGPPADWKGEKIGLTLITRELM